MAWNDSKAGLQAEIARLEARAEVLANENDYLRKQVDNLQGAVISKVAPLAYADMKATEDQSDITAEKEFEQYRKDMKAFSDYAARIEQPFWRDADEMIDQLSQSIGPPNPAEKSLHNNEES